MGERCILMRIRTKSLISEVILIGIILVLAFIMGINSWLVLTLSIGVILVFYCFNDIGKRILLLMFFACFFVFLIGGITVKEFFGYEMIYSFSEEHYNYMIFAIFLSLACLFGGYLLFDKIHIKTRTERTKTVSEEKVRLIRKISLYFQYVFFLAYLVVQIEGIMVVRRSGYFEYYSYESSLPYVITEMADLYFVALFMFLSTLPKKKEAKVPLILFATLNCMSLLTGRRIFFVIDNLIIILYAFFRDNITDDEEKWISKKQIVGLILLMPAVIIFLYSYKYIRMGRSADSNSLSESFLLFFKQQGFSANLIPLGRIYENSLKEDDIFSIYDILRSFRLNPIVRFFTNSSYRSLYTGSRENLALNSGSYSRAISYVVVRSNYLKGYGMGSCYIAELYHDFHYAGICIGSFIYGSVMSKINYLRKGKIVINTLILLMIRGFFKSPRYCYDSPFNVFMTISMWVFIAFVFILAHYEMKRRKRELKI